MALAWALFVYFIYVYAVIMHAHMGPGEELKFLTTWIQFLIVDTVMKDPVNALRSIAQLKLRASALEWLARLFNPFSFFEPLDDEIFRLHLDLEDDDGDADDDTGGEQDEGGGFLSE